MGRIKTSVEEKEKVINDVINAFEEKKKEECGYGDDFYNERIALINKEKDLDKKYKKACKFNNMYELNIEVRKSDRFGESKKDSKEESKKDNKETNEVITKDNEKFIDDCLAAENSIVVNSNSDIIEALKPQFDNNETSEEKVITSTRISQKVVSRIEVDLVKEAIKIGVRMFYASFFSNEDKDMKMVGYKNNYVDVYYIKSVGLIEVINNK